MNTDHVWLPAYDINLHLQNRKQLFGWLHVLEFENLKTQIGEVTTAELGTQTAEFVNNTQFHTTNYIN